MEGYYNFLEAGRLKQKGATAKVAAEMLPREQRSLGLGVLASANAVGDMISSVGVGMLLAAGYQRTAFLIPALFGLAGTLWMFGFARWRHNASPEESSS